jgi:hypothetical protein
MLARLKLPIPKIQQAVLVFDDQTLTLDDLKALSKLLPSADEVSFLPLPLFARRSLTGLSALTPLGESYIWVRRCLQARQAGSVL